MKTIGRLPAMRARRKGALARMAEVDQSQLERIIAGLADIGPDLPGMS